jgi:hypothetical protein
MVRTMPRWSSSSAKSRDVQGLTGRPPPSGASQATATNGHRCSGVNVAGRPRRGPSRTTCWLRSRRVSASASASAAASGGVAWAQRVRPSRTVGSLPPSASAPCRGLAPSARGMIMLARGTSSCGRRRRWIISVRRARGRSVRGRAAGRGPRGVRLVTPPATRLPGLTQRGVRRAD